MDVRQQLNSDLKTAMRDGNKERRDTVRGLLAAVKQVEIDSQSELDNDGVLTVVTKQAKRRRESIEEYGKAGRDDLITVEQNELDIINAYLPQLMGAEEIESHARAAIEAAGASAPQDMGRVMGKLMPVLKGKADGRLVNEIVRKLLVPAE